MSEDQMLPVALHQEHLWGAWKSNPKVMAKIEELGSEADAFHWFRKATNRGQSGFGTYFGALTNAAMYFPLHASAMLQILDSEEAKIRLGKEITVVDLGCGAGANLSAISSILDQERAGIQYIGVEPCSFSRSLCSTISSDRRMKYVKSVKLLSSASQIKPEFRSKTVISVWSHYLSHPRLTDGEFKDLKKSLNDVIWSKPARAMLIYANPVDEHLHEKFRSVFSQALISQVQYSAFMPIERRFMERSVDYSILDLTYVPRLLKS